MGRSSYQPVLESLGRGRFLLLLLSMLAVYLYFSIEGIESRNGWEIAVLSSLMLGTAVIAVSHYGARMMVIAAVLCVPNIVLAIFASAHPTVHRLVLANAATAVFLLFVSITLILAILRGGRVTTDKLIGVVCVYCLMAAAWACAYCAIARLQPGAFRSTVSDVDAVALTPTALLLYPRMLYFSFITLSTVGYGDIVPISAAARAAAVMQAAFGQLFMAIVVARLVSMNIAYATGTSAALPPSDAETPEEKEQKLQ